MNVQVDVVLVDVDVDEVVTEIVCVAVAVAAVVNASPTVDVAVTVVLQTPLILPLVLLHLLKDVVLPSIVFLILPQVTVPDEQPSHEWDTAHMKGHTVPALPCGNQCTVLLDTMLTDNEWDMMLTSRCFKVHNEWAAKQTFFSDAPAMDDGVPGQGGCTVLQIFHG